MPGQAARRRRGPQPPDRIIGALHAALAAELAAELVLVRADAHEPGHEEDEPDPVLGPEWIAAMLLAAASLFRLARRGVSGALPAGEPRRLVEQAPALPEGGWMVGITSAVQQAVGAGRRRGAAAAELLAGARGVIQNWVFRQYSRYVAWLARFAGAESYVWTTRRDERVRALHRLLEGTIQRWDDPPLSGVPAFFGHPGEPGGCRCTAFPILLA